MCQYNYHHYIHCGHIANFTIDTCIDITNLLRQPNSTTTNRSCTRIDIAHDLLPSSHPTLCLQCENDWKTKMDSPQPQQKYIPLEGTTTSNPVTMQVNMEMVRKEPECEFALLLEDDDKSEQDASFQDEDEEIKDKVSLYESFHTYGLDAPVPKTYVHWDDKHRVPESSSSSNNLSTNPSTNSTSSSAEWAVSCKDNWRTAEDRTPTPSPPEETVLASSPYECSLIYPSDDKLDEDFYDASGYHADDEEDLSAELYSACLSLIIKIQSDKRGRRPAPAAKPKLNWFPFFSGIHANAEEDTASDSEEFYDMGLSVASGADKNQLREEYWAAVDALEGEDEDEDGDELEERVEDARYQFTWRSVRDMFYRAFRGTQ
ncbi:hypothetical protein ASPWEDRAFT_738192 [Aspergillus wentii DTO 134E9]|uniref:Uncharacterized protein n=1 Tax=Aspergillus wentii DTO 134E9 TaxID=1073089 RepID=A0A1L9RQ37_ASPWE|nr:uncharacterized protein ASPWEDRAFT_738192 [Aspergillus wentii DTO 134E9]KAI9928436.1 hypothetical protein MW887_002481 [Aspergillus wentii]OJJ37075.1 hypothetical protein ASPWEDRAFT_738192 [Aspergillus wentii DTO 134E9]